MNHYLPDLWYSSRTMVRRTAALLVLVSVVEVTGQRPSAPTVSVDADDIGGVVASAAGPEAGVWVIAETTDLPTRFAKVVTTDEQGRFLVPDLPRATYDLWVRGYGLVDSSRVQVDAGTHSEPDCPRGTLRISSSRVLSRALLVLDAQGSCATGIPGWKGREPGSVAEYGEDRSLSVVPCARDKRYAHRLANVRDSGQLRRGVDSPSPVRQCAGHSWRATSIGSIPNAHYVCSPTGPTASPPASSRRQSRIAHGASSAIL